MKYLTHRFYSEVPDEFLFSQLSSINALAITVKQGKLTTAQKEQLDHLQSNNNNKNGQSGSEEQTTIPVEIKQPCCPWFTCCS